MAELVPTTVTHEGATLSYVAANAGGDTFPNTGYEIIHVKNGGGGTISVTITSNFANPPAGTDNSNSTYTIVAGAEAVMGPFSKRGFDDADGNVEITYTGVTSVTIAVASLSLLK